MIKVLRIQSRLVIGGPSLHTVYLSKSLLSCGYQTILAAGGTEPGEASMLPFAHQNGVFPLIIKEMGRSVNPLADLISFFKILRLIRKEKPHIVHTHTAKAGAIGRVAARLAGVPVIVHTFHGHVFHGYFNPAVTFLYKSLEKFLACFTTAIVVISQQQRKELCDIHRLAQADRFFVVPLGFDFSKFKNMKRGGLKNKLRLPRRKKIVAIIGRLVPIKNHALFIDAVAALDKKIIKDWCFIIVGDGHLRGELEKRVARLNLRENIRFYGWCERVEEIMADIDIIALSSINEGTPVAIIEGLFCGKPVVSTDAGSVREIIKNKDFGIVTTGPSVSDFARALEKGILFYRRDRKAEKKRQMYIEKKYSIDRLTADIHRLYQKLLLKEKV